jgi:hypothetical protein
MLVYVAILRDIELTTDQVICVQTSFNKLETFVKDYFGISDVKTYGNPAECLGYTKINYSEFEDDLDGYFTFKDGDEITKVYVFNKVLDENP